MDNNLYQNIDTPQTNPLEVSQEATPTASSSTSSKLNTKDPKIMALIILGTIFAILAVLAIVVTLVRKSKPQTTVKLPGNNTSITTPIPTENKSVVPTEFQPKFNHIEQDLNSDEDFQPPQIDTQIGL